MSNSEEKKTGESRTINIEIPAGGLEGMLGMMTGRGDSGKGDASCCDMPANRCCPRPEDDEEQEIKIVIKKKER